MSSCCSTESSTCSTASRKRPCPSDGAECVEVKPATIVHHLKAPWTHTLGEQKYYFCESPDCDVVYFGEDDSVISVSDIRGDIGQKRTDKERLLCYCFGVTQHDAETDPTAKAFVIQQTREAVCACDRRNPSGRCCLKDFPKHTGR